MVGAKRKKNVLNEIHVKAQNIEKSASDKRKLLKNSIIYFFTVRMFLTHIFRNYVTYIKHISLICSLSFPLLLLILPLEISYAFPSYTLLMLTYPSAVSFNYLLSLRLTKNKLLIIRNYIDVSTLVIFVISTQFLPFSCRLNNNSLLRQKLSLSYVALSEKTNEGL